MGCDKIRENLSSYLDRELDQTQNDIIKQHLEECEACNEQYRQLSVLKTMMGELPQVAAPPDFLIKLRKRIDSESLSWWRKSAQSLDRLLGKVPLRAMTAAAGVILVVTVLFSSRNTYRPGGIQVSKPWLETPSMDGPDILASSTEPLPVEFASTNPSSLAAPVYLDTPNELLLSIIKNDPDFNRYQSFPHPRGQGVLINHPEYLIEVAMDPSEFPIIQAYLEQQGGELPGSLREAKTVFPIYINFLPSPHAPVPPPKPRTNLYHINHTSP